MGDGRSTTVVAAGDAPRSDWGSVRRLSFANLVSWTGSTAASIALSYHVYQITGSTWWLSAVFLLTLGVTGLLHPFGGMLADRCDRKWLMVGSDLCGALVYAAMLMVGSPGWLLALAFLGALAALPFRSAVWAAIPCLVTERDLAKANSWRSAAINIGRTAGPALGGIAVAAGHVSIVFAANAASFLVSAILTQSIRGSFKTHGHGDSDASLSMRSLSIGFRHVLSSRILLIMVGVWVVLYFCIDIATVADAPLAKEFGMGSAGYGLLDSVFCAGAVLGAVLGSRVRGRWESRSLLISPVSVVIGYGVVAITPWFAMALTGSGAVAACDATAEVAFNSVLQRSCSDAIRGRVIAAIGSMSSIANAISFITAGALLEVAGGRGTYALGAVVAIPAAAVMYYGVRRGLPAGRPADPEW